MVLIEDCAIIKEHHALGLVDKLSTGLREALAIWAFAVDS